MKRNTTLILSCLIVLLIGGCSTNQPKLGYTSVSGTIENGSGKQIIFSSYDGKRMLDTATIASDGTFKVTADNMPLDFYKLQIVGGKELILLVMDSTQQNIEVKADANAIAKTTQISGSKDSELMVDYFSKVEKFRAYMDSVNAQVKSMTGEDAQQIRQALSSQLVREQTEFEKEIAELALANSKSPAAISFLSALTPRNHLEVMKKVHSDLETVMPGSPYLVQLKSQIERATKGNAATAPKDKVAVGQPAPDIVMADLDGKTMKLSSLRGKYVLVDFWASWCGPCRRENPNVVKMYDKYKKDNFEILGVSFDNNKERWAQAIQQDGLKWLHVSDLKKWQSAAAALYGVRSIPYTVLVDPEGNVVATRLRGLSLENKLEEIFGY